MKTLMLQRHFHLQIKTQSVAANVSKESSICFKTIKLPQWLQGLPVVHPVRVSKDAPQRLSDQTVHPPAF